MDLVTILPTHFIPYVTHFFIKIFDLQLQEVGAKRRLNGTSKVNRHTNKHMDISTYRKHRPRGPML